MTSPTESSNPAALSAGDLLARADRLRALHEAPELLVMVNVWDVATARVVAEAPGAQAIATASYSIAEANGYQDGENISRDLMLDVVGRIAAAVSLPVSADLEAGYGDVAETVRRAIGVGAVGGNVEDGMCPFDEAVARMAAAVRAGEDEGVPFVLNARTDPFLLGEGRDPADLARDAIERGRAFLDVGATCVFVPGLTDRGWIEQVVDGIGRGKVSLISSPDSPSQADLAGLGISRISYGPGTQFALLKQFAQLATDLLAGADLPG